MENGFNKKEKRVRKRIIVKPGQPVSPPANRTERFNDPKSEGRDGDRVFNGNKDGYNQAPFRPWERNKSYTPGKKKPYGGFDKKGYKPSQDDEVFKHSIFKNKTESSGGLNKSQNTGNLGGDQQIRLNKFISNSGLCSRREADELITKGVISVNGTKITELGYKVFPTDTIEHNGKRITEASHVYILLNKPKDTITTTNDPENRLTVMDLVKKATHQRIFPIGRLDRNTTGVILLTNDGDFAQKLSHPSSEVRKVYYAVLDKPLEVEDFDKLMAGVVLDDGPMKADEMAYVDPRDRSIIGIQIHSGKNRIVHRMFEHLGYRLKKLDRVVYAGLDKGGLRRSKWRFLRYDEVQNVLNSIKYQDEKNP